MYSATNNKSQTIGASGCGTTSAAMVIAELRDSKVTPKETSAWSVANGYRSINSGTEWSFFPAIMKKYNIPCRQTALSSEAITALKKGYMVICTAGKGIWTNSGHVMLAYGLSADGSKVLINDPNSEATNREIANLSNFRTEMRQYWIIEEEWNVEIKNIQVVHSSKGTVDMKSVNVGGENFVRLRDTALIAPIEIGWNGKNPTVKILVTDNTQVKTQITALETALLKLKSLV